MKKIILPIGILAFSAFALVNCGGKGDEAAQKSDAKPEMPEQLAEETSTNEEESVQDFSSAEEASEAYKEALEDYAEAMESGNKEEAEALKAELKSIKELAGSKFAAKELEALNKLAEVSMKLEKGQKVDLDNAFKAYGKAMEAYGAAMEGMTNDPSVKEAMKASGQVMKAYGDAMDAMGGMEDF
jgi:arginyl-tRNA synthetase